MSAFPNARFIKSANAPQQFLAGSWAEVAFAGRSNAGKSSAINAITQRQGLAKTSKTPGATQLINFFELAPGMSLADLPGYGFAKVPRAIQDHWQGLLETYFRSREGLKVMFLIVDSRRGLKDQDFEMIDFAVSCGRAVHVLLTKADKLAHHEKLKIRHDTEALLQGHASCQLFSATQKIGVDEARSFLKRYLRQKRPDGGEPTPG
jgi:GTP-binding protein